MRYDSMCVSMVLNIHRWLIETAEHKDREKKSKRKDFIDHIKLYFFIFIVKIKGLLISLLLV